MTTKKKIILSVSIICLLLLVGIVAVVVVFSATKNTTTSNIKVTYTANQISGTATAYYGITGDSSWTSMYVDGDSSKGTILDFSANKGEMTGTLSPATTNNEVSVTAEKPYAVFKYAFTNNSGANKINVSMTESNIGTPTNFEVKYLTGTTDYAIADAYTQLDTNGTTNYSTTEVNVKVGDTVGTQYVYVLVEIIDDTIDAEFSSSFSFVLTKGSAVQIGG